MKQVLLDTNAYSNLLKGDKDIFDFLSFANKILMSVIVLGELYAGFRSGTKYNQNVKYLMDFMSDPDVNSIKITEETSEIFGDLKNELRKKGSPIPINDIWIAAQCIETGAVLMSYDKHFNLIPQVRLWNK